MPFDPTKYGAKEVKQSGGFDPTKFGAKPIETQSASKPLPSIQEQGYPFAPAGTYNQEPKPFDMKSYLQGEPQQNHVEQHLPASPAALAKVGATHLPDIKEAIDKAVIDRNKQFGVHDKPDMNFGRDEITKKVKSGDLIPDFDVDGNSVLKKKTGLFDSFINSVNKASVEKADDANLLDLDNEGKIKYLEAKKIIDAKNDNTKAGGIGKLGEFAGENADVLAKTAVGAMTGGAITPELVGAGHFGGFLNTVKDFATNSYGNALQKTYNELRHQGMPEKQAMEQAHKAGLVGAATGIGTGAVLTGLPKLKADNGVVHDFINTLIKSSAKLGAVSGAEAGVNDLGEIGVGVHKNAKEIINDIGENAAHGVAVGAAFETLLNIHKVPGAVYEQARRVVSSIPEAARNKLLDDAVTAGELWKEKADEIKSAVSEDSPIDVPIKKEYSEVDKRRIEANRLYEEANRLPPSELSKKKEMWTEGTRLRAEADKMDEENKSQKDNNALQTEQGATTVSEQGVPSMENMDGGKPKEDELINQAKESAHEINEMYRQPFLDDPKEGLRQVAEQLNGSESEARTTRKTFGDKVSDIALQLYPDAKTETPTNEINTPKTDNPQTEEVELSKAGGTEASGDSVPKETVGQKEGGVDETPIKSAYKSRIDNLDANSKQSDITKLGVGDYVHIPRTEKSSGLKGFVKKIGRTNVVLDTFYQLGSTDNDGIMQEHTVKKSDIKEFIKPKNEQPIVEQSDNIPTTTSTDKVVPTETPKAEVPGDKKPVQPDTNEAGQGDGKPPATVLNEGEGGGKSEPVGITHAATDKLAEELGLPDRYEKDPTTREKQDAEAVKRIGNGEMPAVIEKLKRKEMPSDIEQRMMAHHLGELKADYEKTKSDKTLLEIKKLKALSDEMGGREVAKSLQARQDAVHPLEGGEASAKVARMEALGVDKLTDKQKAEVEKMVNEYKSIAENEKAKREEIQKKYDDYLAEQELAKMKAEKAEASKGKKPSATKKKTHDDFVSERKSLKEQLQEAKEKHLQWLKDQGIQQAGASPLTFTTEMAKIVAKIIKNHFDEGVQVLSDLTKKALEDVREIFPEATERDIKDVLVGKYNKKQETKSELKAKWEDIRQEQKLLDDLASEVAKTPKTEKEKTVRNQRLADLRKAIGEKRMAEIEADKHQQKLNDLNEELERVRSRKAKDPVEKGKPKEVSPEEQEVLDKIQAEQDKWNEEKDSARQAARDYQKMETERNRQLKRVGELKEKLATLQKGELPKGEPNAIKVDTPEIEALKKEIADTEKSVREDIAHQKMMDGLETELQRIKDRKEKEKQPDSKRVISDEEKAKRDEIEAEQKAWDIEKNIEKLNTELQRVRDRKAKEKKPQNRRALTDLEKELVSQLFDEKAAWAKEVEPERKLRQAIKSTQKSIAELEEKIRARNGLRPQGKAELVTSPELESLRKEKARLQARIKKIKYNTGIIDEQKIKNIIRSNNATKLKYLQRIADGKFENEPKLPFSENFEFKRKYPELFNQAMDAIKEKEEAKKAFDIALTNDKISKENGLKKAYRWLGKVKNTLQSTVAGVDDSLMFVQLGYSIVVNPGAAVNFKMIKDANGKVKFVLGGAIKEHVLDAWSKKRFDRQMTAMHESAAWPLIKASGLDVLEPQSLLDKQKEEMFQHNLAHYIGIGTIPMGEKASLGDSQLKRVNLGKFLEIWERAYTSLGNNMRVNMFLRQAHAMYENGMTIENNLEEFKGVAKAINNLTGRGSTHPIAAQVIPYLTPVIWSPKMIASSINLLGISDIISGGQAGFYTKLPPKARAYAAKQMADGIAASVGFMVAAAIAGYTVHYSPHDPRWGDIEYGKDGSQSWNVWGRYGSMMRMIMQILPSFLGGGRMNSKGVVEDVGDEGGKTRGQVVGGFLRGKMNPVSGLAFDYAMNDKKGYYDKKPLTLGNSVKDITLPMSLRDVRKEIERDGTISLLTYELPNFVGMQMKDQRDFYSNQTGDDTIDAFLEKNKIKVPAVNTITTPKDSKHPDGKASDDEKEQVISHRDKLIKKAIEKAMKQNDNGPSFLSDKNTPEAKKANDERIKWISEQALKDAEAKVFGKHEATVTEQLKKSMEDTKRDLFKIGLFH